MILYIMRHAEAVDSGNALIDTWRYLTKQGRSNVKKMRSKMMQHGPEPSVIITSPLVRAVQTAEIFAEQIKNNVMVIANGLLQPGADINKILRYLKSEKMGDCIMIVGHEPTLGYLAAALLGQKNNSISLKKGACIAVDVNFEKTHKASFIWYLVPGEACITSLSKAFES